MSQLELKFDFLKEFNQALRQIRIKMESQGL